jgi:beta-glucosidase
MITGGTGSGDVNEAYSVSLTDGLKAKGFRFDTAFATRYRQTIEAEKSKRPKMANPFLLPPPIGETIIPLSEIQSLAGTADVAIVTIGRNSGEFADRNLENDFYLDMREKDLLRNVTRAFHNADKKVVVILNVGGVIEMASWKDSVDAVLLAWQPGQEAGNAIVDILTGAVNPSGKLAVTFPVRYEDVSSAKNFPGAADDPKEVVYEEGIYVGYRYADKFKKAPAYPFGFGRSYTSFAYSNLQTSVSGDILTVSVDVRNTGSRPGKEVVQVYVGAPQTIDNPEKELRAFGKTGLLQPGAKETLRFRIPVADLASFYTSERAWITDAGTYTVFAAASSADVRQQTAVQLPRAIRRPVKARMAPQMPVSELK